MLLAITAAVLVVILLFHGGNAGSNPAGDAKKIRQLTTQKFSSGPECNDGVAIEKANSCQRPWFASEAVTARAVGCTHFVSVGTP